MARKNNSALFFLCSLIEYIGRSQKLTRQETVERLGRDSIEQIYEYADVLHCEPIGKVAWEFIQDQAIPCGNFDNESECRYEVPDYWTMGEVYERLIEDVTEEERDIVSGVLQVYGSWIDEELSNYNSDFYYQPRDYIAACYKAGKIL